MHIGSVLGLVFVSLFAFTFWEYRLIHDLDAWAGLTGLRVLTLRGVLREGHSGDLSAPPGFRLQRIEPGKYLVRAAEWNEPGARLDTSFPWIVALFRIVGREWTLDVRFGLGILVTFSAAVATPLDTASRASAGSASNSCCSVAASCNASKRVCLTMAVLMRSSHAW